MGRERRGSELLEDAVRFTTGAESLVLVIKINWRYYKFMNIKFLGTGGAFQTEKGNSAAIVTLNDKNILIDCGFTTFQTLQEKNLTGSIDYILITHLHGDHVGSLPSFLAYCDVVHEKLPEIIYPSEALRKDIDHFLEITFE